MRLKTEAEFKAHLASGPLQRLYLFCGEETYLKQRCVQQLLKKVAPQRQADFNLHRFDSAAKIDDIADAVLALPFMGERMCVLVTDLEVDKLAAKPFEKCKELLESLPESSVLILQFLSASFDSKKNAKCKVVAGLAEKIGALCELETLWGVQLVAFVRAQAQKGGAVISTQTAQFLIERFGEDAQGLSLELSKLCSYVQGGEITREVVERCTPLRPDSSSFDLARAILAGNYGQALQDLQELFDQREAPVAILGALSMSFIDLYRAKLAAEQKVSISQVIEDFAYRGRDFRIKNAMRDQSRYSTRFLTGVLGRLEEADQKLKTQRVDEQALLQRLVTEIFVLRQKEGRN